MIDAIQDDPGLATCVVGEPSDQELLEGLRTGDQIAATALLGRLKQG